MQDQYYTFNMFDAQAWVARDFMMGSYKIPSKPERRLDINKWLIENEKLKSCHNNVDFQTEYIKDLLSLSNYPDFNVDKVAEMFKEWLQDKDDNILTYRDKNFRSVVTGSMAETHHTEWMNELDDSKERYLFKHESEEITEKEEHL